MGAGQQVLICGGGTGGGGPSDPSTIANLELWLHGRSVAVGDGNPVTTWADSSGNARDAGAIGASRPTLRSTGGPNSQPCLEFDGSDDSMTLPDFATGFTAGHLFIVVKIDNDPPASGGVAGCPLRVSTSGGDASFYPFTDGVVYENWGSTTRKTVANPTPSLAAWHVYEIVSKASSWKAFINGTQIGSTDTGNTVGFVSVLRIALNANSNRLDGRIAEIIWYSAEKTGADLTAIKTYLNFWTGITIA